MDLRVSQHHPRLRGVLDGELRLAILRVRQCASVTCSDCWRALKTDRCSRLAEFVQLHATSASRTLPASRPMHRDMCSPRSVCTCTCDRIRHDIALWQNHAAVVPGQHRLCAIHAQHSCCQPTCFCENSTNTNFRKKILLESMLHIDVLDLEGLNV